MRQTAAIGLLMASTVTAQERATTAEPSPSPTTAGATPDRPARRAMTPPAAGVPIRVLTKLHGQMDNAIQGIGLVTGLNGTGSGDVATRRLASNLIRKNRLLVTESELTRGSIAIVTVTAKLPSFAKEGHEIDVYVQAMTDATSLQDGVLQPTELQFFDGAESVTYVVASGTVGVGGFGVRGRNGRLSNNTPTSGIIARGGNVVHPVSPDYVSEDGSVQLILRRPSLATAQNIVAAANRVLDGTGARAELHDESMLRIELPPDHRNDAGALRVLGLVGPVRVLVEQPTAVIVNQANGSIVAGAGVQIMPCVVAVSDLTISVTEDDQVSQPFPGLNRGTSQIVGRTHIDVATIDSELRALPGGGATVGDLLANLKALDLPPRNLIEVFKELDHGGFLQAPLIIR